MSISVASAPAVGGINPLTGEPLVKWRPGGLYGPHVASYSGTAASMWGSSRAFLLPLFVPVTSRIDALAVNLPAMEGNPFQMAVFDWNPDAMAPGDRVSDVVDRPAGGVMGDNLYMMASAALTGGQYYFLAISSTAAGSVPLISGYTVSALDVTPLSHLGVTGSDWRYTPAPAYEINKPIADIVAGDVFSDPSGAFFPILSVRASA